MKTFKIYYKGFRLIKGYTVDHALSKAKIIKGIEPQKTKTLIKDSFIDNFPFLINLCVWTLLMFTLVELVKLSSIFEYIPLRVIYLMSLLILLGRFPSIGRSCGYKYFECKK